MPSLPHAGATLWYDERGAGAPVLLIHGGLFDPMDGERFWIRPGVADAIAAAGHRVLVPDRRYGGGRTHALVAPHTWQVEVGDMAAVLRHAGAGPVHVVAGSNGCSVATRLALDYPAVVRRLTLCWLGNPDNPQLTAAFERSAAYVEQAGPAAYLEGLRREGLPRPETERPGFPFGVALLRDEAAATAFAAMSPAAAARAIRDTAAAMLAGSPLRALSDADAETLGRLGIPIAIVPADPTDRWHPRSAAECVAAAIPGARLLDEIPVTPSPLFPERLAEFVGALLLA